MRLVNNNELTIKCPVKRLHLLLARAFRIGRFRHGIEHVLYVAPELNIAHNAVARIDRLCYPAHNERPIGFVFRARAFQIGVAGASSGRIRLRPIFRYHKCFLIEDRSTKSGLNISRGNNEHEILRIRAKMLFGRHNRRTRFADTHSMIE